MCEMPHTLEYTFIKLNLKIWQNSFSLHKKKTEQRIPSLNLRKITINPIKTIKIQICLTACSILKCDEILSNHDRKCNITLLIV